MLEDGPPDYTPGSAGGDPGVVATGSLGLAVDPLMRQSGNERR